MAETAFQKQYRQEFVGAFEFGQSMLRTTTTTEMVRQGNEAIFLVAGTGGALAGGYNCTDLASAPGSNNQVSKTFSSQFENTATDFRAKSTATDLANGTPANPTNGVCTWQTSGACNWPVPVIVSAFTM